MVDEELATVEELAERLPFEMDADDEREAQGALEDLSDAARRYGRGAWTKLNTPGAVKRLVLKAAVRHMKNYDGYVSSRAGDEAVTWTDRGDNSGSAYFTTEEIQALRTIAGVGSGLYTAQAGWGTSTRRSSTSPTGMVNAGAGQRPIPYFADDDGNPW